MKWEDFRAERKRHGKPFIVSHRGANKLAPENTIKAFELALQQGAFALETDLHFTHDDHLVLHHDPTLERTTTGGGHIRDYPLAELKKIRTLDPITGEPSDEPIPTLVELIQKTRGETPLLLELKDPLFQDRKYASHFIEVLTEYQMVEQCAIISFQPAHIATIKELAPQIPCGLITMTNAVPRRGVELLGPAFPLVYLNPMYVKWAHSWDGVVCPLDTTPEKRMGYYLWLDVDAVLADDVSAAVAAMDASASAIASA